MATDDRITRTMTGNVVTFNVPGFDPLTLDVAELNDDVRQHAMLHGLIQTIGDAAALSYKQPDGSIRRPTLAEKRAEMANRIITLKTGVWSAAREAGAGSDPYTSMVVEAIANVTGKDAEAVRDFMAKLSVEEKRELRNAPAVQKEMAKIRLARASKAPSNDAATSILDRLTGAATAHAEIVKAKKSKK